MRSISFIIAIYVFVLLISCSEKANLDPRERIANVECILTGDSIQILHLSYSSYISESHYPVITKGEINVEESDTLGMKNTYTFHCNANGVWQASFTPKPSAKYTLSIEVPGEKPIKAITTYPDTTVFRPFKGNVESGRYRSIYSVNCLMSIFYENSYRFPSYQIYSPTDFVLWIYGMDYSPASDNWEQTELICATYCNYDSFNVTDIFKDDVPEFKHAGNYEIDYPEVLEYGYPQYLQQKTNFIQPMHFRYVRININGTEFLDQYMDNTSDAMHICANFKQHKHGIPHPKSYLVFEAVSDEYDNYLKDLVSFEMGIGDIDKSDLTHLWQTKKLYTNIENGVGIFGASYRKNVPINDYKVIYDGDTGIKYYKKY